MHSAWRGAPSADGKEVQAELAARFGLNGTQSVLSAAAYIGAEAVTIPLGRHVRQVFAVDPCSILIHGE